MIRSLLDEEHWLTKMIDCCSLDEEYFILQRWLKLRECIGQSLLEEAILKTANHFNVVIVANPTKKASMGQFLRADTQSKKMWIKSATIEHGVAAGFIVTENCEGLFKSQLTCQPGAKKFYAVDDRGQIKFISSPSLGMHPVGVLTYPNGKLVTSDVDLVVIAPLIDSSDCRILTGCNFGELSNVEYEILNTGNSIFSSLLDECYPHDAPHCFEIFTHGPSNKFSKSKQSHLHFPMSVFYPTGDSKLLGDNVVRLEALSLFVDCMKNLKNQGRVADLNPCWELEDLCKLNARS